MGAREAGLSEGILLMGYGLAVALDRQPGDVHTARSIKRRPFVWQRSGTGSLPSGKA